MSERGDKKIEANETRKQIKNYTCRDVCKGMESALNFKRRVSERKREREEDKKGTRNIVVARLGERESEKNYLKSLDIILPFSCLNVSSELINKKMLFFYFSEKEKSCQ